MWLVFFLSFFFCLFSSSAYFGICYEQKVPSQLVALATNDFLVFIYSFLYLNTAPNLSALCCLMWQGPKPQWAGGYSFDYANSIFNLVLGGIVFLEVILSSGTWWDHIKPHILFTVHCGRNYSLATVWLKKWRQLCLRASVWHLGSHKAMDFFYELQVNKKRRCPEALAPHSASHLQWFQANPDVWMNSAVLYSHFQVKIKLADKSCLFTVI